MPLALRTLAIFFLLWPLAASAARPIVVFGDSLSAAYGIARSSGWVALIAARVQRERPAYRVVNASISGETSAGGRSRIDELLARERPAVLILELGANDGLRGLPLEQMRSNLAAIIERAQKARARVLLVGMKMPPNYGPDYTAAFERAFAELARRYKTAFVPFLLEGFAEQPDYFQPDHIHPTAEAQGAIAERVWQALRPLLN